MIFGLMVNYFGDCFLTIFRKRFRNSKNLPCQLCSVDVPPKSLGDKRAVSKRVVLADVPPERKPEGGYIWMFPRNEKRNEGTFGCSPERKPERGHIRQRHPFMKPPFCFPSYRREFPLRESALPVLIAEQIAIRSHANLRGALKIAAATADSGGSSLF